MAERPPKILVVDDIPENVRLLEAVLVPRGYEVVTANDGVEALDRVASEEPDLILLDVMMPGVDGWEMLRLVQERHGVGEIPVIMFSGQVESSDDDAVARGAQGFLGKPFNPQDLITRTKDLLRA
jgi:CheY-like chemotaxis protein